MVRGDPCASTSFRLPVKKATWKWIIVTDITARNHSLSVTLPNVIPMQAPPFDESNLSLPQASVARQPIFERDQKIFGYELLFRQPGDQKAIFNNPIQATAQVIFSAFFEIGVERMVGSAQAFINVTNKFILENHCRFLPKDRVVFEIASEATPDPALLQRLKTLSGEGFRFALEGVGEQPQLDPMLPYCAFVKVDLRKANRNRLKEESEALQALNVAMLAEKIQTFEEYQTCQQMGFEYFQGNFICKPSIVSSPKLPLNPETVSRLLSMLNEPKTTAADIEAFLSEDSAFSYRLLRYIDSELVSFPLKRESIRHAVERIGIENLRTIVGLVMMTEIDALTRSAEGRTSRKPSAPRNADLKPE